MHSGTAMFAQSAICETFQDQTAWEGVVHLFDFASHPTATRVYAWSSPIEDSAKHRFFAVLYQPPVESPQAAVKAAIVVERQAKQK